MTVPGDFSDFNLSVQSYNLKGLFYFMITVFMRVLCPNQEGSFATNLLLSS